MVVEAEQSSSSSALGPMTSSLTALTRLSAACVDGDAGGGHEKKASALANDDDDDTDEVEAVFELCFAGRATLGPAPTRLPLPPRP